MRFVCARVVLLVLVHASIAFSAFASCAAPKNPVEAENCLAGNPLRDWYIAGAGSPNIQGFTTDISVNVGQTVFFKIATNAVSYRIDIYRLGYYQGNGARFIASVSPSVSLPQTQPACLTDSSTGLIDCGNWTVSASWVVPSTATSGIYFAKLVRLDTGEAGLTVFIVRNDSSHSDILVQTCDPTWHAYNDYGGSSLYTGPTTRAFKVSYNRPFNVPEMYTWLFTAEYPMLRWLEANGYDASYFAGVDTDRRGQLLTQHKIFMSVGHDEYWSGGQRSNVEAARAAGVNLAFFSGNEIFWKTRWESSVDGMNTPYRTLVSYKETIANAVLDPLDPPIWTGIWRDPSFTPPADGGRPENALSGTIFWVNEFRNDPIYVPQADGQMRFWRNTSIATLQPGQVATLPAGTLGYEWDVDADNGFRPPGLFPLSTTTVAVSTYLLDNHTFGNGVATHHLTMYRASSGALVFGAGTVQWSWGLDATHAISGTPTDPNMQQATVNLLADMGVQPATLQSGLVPAIPSTDTAPPRSVITSTAPGNTVTVGSPVTIYGTAVDSGGGVVGAVEVSIDGGKTWHPAFGRESWSYTFAAGNSGTLNVRSRAVDDSGNLEIPGPGIAINAVPRSCPCTIWPSTAIPAIVDAGPYSPLELGVRFRADSSGYITGIRFYKGSNNIGTHVGNLWSSSGVLLASATFAGETASGWQQVNFPIPVPIAANTLYVASYRTSVGHFSEDWNYFATSAKDNAPLHAATNGNGGSNGVYARASANASVFPANTYIAANYWVDVVFNSSAGGILPLSVSTTSLPNGTQSAGYNQNLTAVGGTTPYSWLLFSGTLPLGLVLSPNGQISGTPTTLGTSNFTVQVTDSSAPVQTVTQALSIAIAGPTDTISVSTTPLTSSLLVTGSQQFTAAVTNDAANAGVVWTVADTSGTDCPGAVCGTVSPTQTASGAPITYTAPAAVPPGGRVTVKATSVTDNTKSGGTIVTVTAGVNNARLKGDYAFTFNGISGNGAVSSAFAAVGRFTADGAGNLTSGELDTNGIGPGATVNAQSFTGTYATGADNRGVMTFDIGGHVARLAFAMMANGNAQFIEFDAGEGTGTIGSGIMEKVDTTAYSATKIKGDYAFGAAGLDNSNNRAAIAGRFTSDGAGNLTDAVGDVNAYGSVYSMTFTAANYAVGDTTRGRGIINLAFLIGGVPRSLNFVFYIVNEGKLFGMEMDPVTSRTPLLNSVVLRQQSPAGGFSNSLLNGNMVIYLTGLSVCGSGAGAASKVLAGLFAADGNGALTLAYDENCGGISDSGTGQFGTYSVASNGRTSITVGNGAVAYLVGLNQAFLFSSDSSVLFGFGEPQAAGLFTNTAVKGPYVGSTITPGTFGVNIFSGEFTADGASPTGNITGIEDIGAPSGPKSSVAFNASYSLSSSSTNGRGIMAATSGSGGNAIAYVISPSKLVAVPLSDLNPAVLIFEKSSSPPIFSLSSLSLNPTIVIGGTQSSRGTVRLSGPAPAGGAKVLLSSGNAGTARVPSSVTIPAGATSATFTVKTSMVLFSTSVKISASYDGTTQTARLTVVW
jgi:hypothetical protein